MAIFASRVSLEPENRSLGNQASRDKPSPLRNAKEDTSGNATIEFVLWFPLLIVLIGLAVEVGMTFFEMNRAWDIARDTTRRVAVGEMTPQDGETYAKENTAAYLNPQIAIAEVGTRDIKFDMTISPHIGIFGVFSIIEIPEVNIRYIMRREMDSNTGAAENA